MCTKILDEAPKDGGMNMYPAVLKILPMLYTSLSRPLSDSMIPAPAIYRVCTLNTGGLLRGLIEASDANKTETLRYERENKAIQVV